MNKRTYRDPKSCGSTPFVVWASPTADMYQGLIIMFFLVPFLLYLNEVRRSRWRRYLKNMTDDPNVLTKFMVECIAFQPEVAFEVVCSHTETTYSTDSDGNQTSSTHTVVTHNSCHPCTFSRFADHSDFSGRTQAEIQAAEAHWAETKSSILEIDSSWNIVSSDGSFEKAKLHVYETHRHLDTTCVVSTKKCEPPCFKSEQCLKIHAANPLLSITGYWIFSLMYLTIPFRMYFERCTGTLKLTFEKSFTNLQVASQTGTPTMVTPGGCMQPQVGGGAVVPMQAAVGTAAVAPSAGLEPTALEVILQLKGLLDAGAITEEEFQAKKLEQLSRM